MHPDDGQAKKEFADKIAIADRIHAVLTYPGKAQLTRDQGAVQDNGGPSERPRAERKHIGSLQTISQTFDIARERFGLAQQVVRKINRLGALQMRIPWHDKIDIFLGKTEKSRL